MDTKDREPEYSQYVRLKKKYSQHINKPRKGISCKVEFFETHRCTELFFLYYFRYTSRMYTDQESLLTDSIKVWGIARQKSSLQKCKGLHSYFENNGGSLESAIVNAAQSMNEKSIIGRDYTYSELGRLVEKLKKMNYESTLITLDRLVRRVKGEWLGEADEHHLSFLRKIHRRHGNGNCENEEV